MKTFISVIVPVYNMQDYLNRCINSILTQSYNHFELIIVDDGSTDESGEMIDAFGKADSRVIVFHQTNGGSSSARNLAISKAKGEYLCFVDSDDYLERNFLERLVLPIERAKEMSAKLPQIVQIGRDEIAENGDKLPDICTSVSKEKVIPSKDFFEALLMHKGDCSFCTKMTQANLFVGKQFPVGKLNEDFYLLTQMLLEVEDVVCVPGIGYHVFYKSESNSRKRDKNSFSKVFADNVENADMIESMVLKHYPDLRTLSVRFALYQRLDYLLHIPISCMRSDYSGYPECVSYIRRHFFSMLSNRYLTVKNKVYLVLFAIAPKGIRVVHRTLKRI